MRLLSFCFVIEALCTPASASERPLRFLYIQGFLSCSVAHMAPVNHYFDAIKDHPDAKLIYGCFDGGFAEHPLDPTEHFYVYTRTPSSSWSEPEKMDAQSAPLAIALMLRNEIKELRELNLETPSSTPLMNLTIAGHSHGAWIAMRLAYQASLIPQLKLKDLLTIDPVSYVECPSEWFPWHVISSTFNWFGDHSACHRAPKDLEGLGPIIAKTANFHWTNVYETSMPYLSSGRVLHATVNAEYTGQTTYDWLTAHRSITKDPNSWKRFYERMAFIVQNPDNDED